jgi:hypothetical protein
MDLIDDGTLEYRIISCMSIWRQLCSCPSLCHSVEGGELPTVYRLIVVMTAYKLFQILGGQG